MEEKIILFFVLRFVHNKSCVMMTRTANNASTIDIAESIHTSLLFALIHLFIYLHDLALDFYDILFCLFSIFLRSSVISLSINADNQYLYRKSIASMEYIK